jgi:hypothetical protein
VRATRAYIAGFGTAGSLLAGAAIVFVFASAVVSFQGWPQVGDQGTPVAVIARSEAPAQSSSAGARSFVALASAQAAAVTGQARTRTRGPAGGLAPAGSPTAIIAKPGLGSRGPHRSTFASTTPVASGPATPPTGCNPCARPPLTSVLGSTTQAAAGSLGTAVTSAGSRLGSAVSGLTGAVGGKLGGLSPGLGHVVTGAGQAVGGTVSSATGALGSTLAGVGKGLGGLLARHQGH